MPSYCSISEAWGDDFNLNKNNVLKNTDHFKRNNNTAAKPNDQELDNHMPINTNYEIKESFEDTPDKIENNPTQNLDKCDCKKLLQEVLKCKECQELIYNHIKNQYQSSIQILSNNDILNSVFIGLFIILVLDLFVKIGRINSSKA